MTEKKLLTPTRTAVEKFTEEEGQQIYGAWGWLQCVLKSQQTHEGSRHERNLAKDEKAKKKKEKNKKDEEE